MVAIALKQIDLFWQKVAEVLAFLASPFVYLYKGFQASSAEYRAQFDCDHADGFSVDNDFTCPHCKHCIEDNII